MQENPYEVPTYCRYCAHIKRESVTDVFGEYGKNFCEIKDRYYSDKTLRRANYCEDYKRSGTDVLQEKKEEKPKANANRVKKENEKCKYCGVSVRGYVSEGLCNNCKEKLPVVREIVKLGESARRRFNLSDKY